MAWFGALNGDAIDHILPSDWRARLPDPLDKRFTVEYRTLSLVKALNLGHSVVPTVFWGK